MTERNIVLHNVELYLLGLTRRDILIATTGQRETDRQGKRIMWGESVVHVCAGVCLVVSYCSFTLQRFLLILPSSLSLICSDDDSSPIVSQRNNASETLIVVYWYCCIVARPSDVSSIVYISVLGWIKMCLESPMKFRPMQQRLVSLFFALAGFYIFYMPSTLLLFKKS